MCVFVAACEDVCVWSCMYVCVCVCAMSCTMQSVRSVRSVILSRGSVDSLKRFLQKEGLLMHWVHRQTHVSFGFFRVVCRVLCVAGDNVASVSISYPRQRPLVPSAESGSRHCIA